MTNGNQKPKRTLFLGVLPAVPVLLVGIWLICWPLLSYHIISKATCTGIILGTVVWFIIWLRRASQRD